MKCRRLLAVLVCLVLMLSVIAPAANAVPASRNPISYQGNGQTVNTNKIPVSSSNTLLPDEAKGPLTLRTDGLLGVYLEEDALAQSQNRWTAVEVEKQLELAITSLPEELQDLARASEYFDANESVAAFVVMEGDPILDLISVAGSVKPYVEARMLDAQDQVIASIEAEILDGEELDVRYQFTNITNSFTIATEFKNLVDIARLDGVKSVFVMPVFNPVETADPNTGSASEMTGAAQVWQDLGYTGAGMKIAIIDTGLDLDHPSFAADPELTEDSLTADDIDAVLQDLNAYAIRSTVTGDTLYRSAKVPFAFNYVDGNLTADHSSDYQGDHGTHVAGIAAANKLDTTNVVGMAPDAQIIVMKVFGASGGAYMDDIAAALEDAMALGCDVVNASLGSAAGFSSSNSELDLIYQRLASQDIVAHFSAGNEGTSAYGNMWGLDLNRTENPETGLVGSPSTYPNVFSIASAGNAVVMSDYFAVGDSKVFYNETYQAALGYTYSFKALLEGGTYDFAMVPGVGEETDFYDEDGNSLVEGKIAVVSRGEINYGTKVLNAEMAGAVGCVIYNNNNTDDIFSMYMNIAAGDDPTDPASYLPCCMISLADGQAMAAAEEKTMYVAEDLAGRETVGGQMSSFSSWGVTSDLRLLPDVTGIGGNVYSCYDGGEYGLMSGTSMSSPQVAGVTALVMQYLKELYPSAPAGSLREMAMALVMSTAKPIIDLDSGVEASPRQQGAGLVDAYAAINTQAYLTVGGNRPKVELGSSSTGKYQFSFEIHNISDTAKTYTLDASLLSEAVASAYGEYFMREMDWELDGTVTFSKDTVTVPAGQTASITATVTLSDDDKALIQAVWPNGTYVEGYVYLNTDDGEGGMTQELSLPFMGFYGDWTDAPVFDSAYWYEDGFWGAGNGWPDGDMYYHIPWTSLAGSDWVLGFNPYSGPVVDADGHVIYDPSHNTVSPNGDGLLDGLSELYLSLLRNAKELTLTYTVGDEVVYTETSINNPKTIYNSNYGQVVPWIYSWYGNGMYDFTDANGDPLPSGTDVMLTITAKVDYAGGGDHQIQIPITVDTEAPELLNVYQFEEEGTLYLGVEVADAEAIAAVILMNPTGTQYYGEQYDVNMTPTEDGYLAVFNITNLGTEFLVCLGDYAANESYYDISYETDVDNLPDMPTDLIYAYRVYDNYLQSDHMYGWVAFGAPAADEDANLYVLTDDYLEYAAINAAEQAGGKVFAIDAVGNFVVMDPGLYNRITICNLGVDALDMTFDDSTDTMYVLAKNDYSETTLYSVDLMTGELTEVKYFGWNTAPFAIADDDNGTLYAIAQYGGTLYTLSADTEYAMTEVLNGEDPFVVKRSNGNAISPSYAQGMMYEDGKLYLSYFHYSWMGGSSELITIDMETLEAQYNVYCAQGYDGTEVVDYYPGTELVGLHSLKPTEYQLPVSDTLTGLRLSTDSVVLALGASARLTASPMPWNYDLGEVVWTSSDETVVTVVNGTVTAVGEGVATITATSDGVSATCTVLAVDVDSSFNAYNYYSMDNNYGYMIEVDTGSMDYILTAVSPVDFVAGDYNGHDGWFYGYDMNGQLYRYDQENDLVEKLGQPVADVPLDMAYDYSSGLMYALTSGYYGDSTICLVDLSNGKQIPVAEYYYLMTLACDTEGNLYAIDDIGDLYMWTWQDGVLEGEYVTSVLDQGYLYYQQSMCWDHNKNVLLWSYCEGATVMWIDLEQELTLSLGDPTEAGMFIFVGMYTVPEEIPALADVAVESMSADDMVLLAGTTKAPIVNILPTNATCKDVAWVSADPTIVKVNADGTITGVAEGSTTITGTMTDPVSGNPFTAEFTVQVYVPADNLYAHVQIDLSTYDGQYWIRMYPQDPENPDILSRFPYTIYAEEYVDGKLYAYACDLNDWDANMQFMILDPKSYAVLEQFDMGDGFPFVYDMTYDYTNGVMLATAGVDREGQSADLYLVDMVTGELQLFMQTEQAFMSLAATESGMLYAIENSAPEYDGGIMPWSLDTYSDSNNAMLYAIDPIAKTVELVGDTGIQANMVGSMTYDYDTQHLYWAPTYEGTGYISNLCIVDTETGAAVSLGTPCGSGALITGMYVVSDTVPQAGTTLKGLLLTPEKAGIFVGDTLDLTTMTLPVDLEDCEFDWFSYNQRVATVDENGTVTAVAPGKATIVLTVTQGDTVLTAKCEIAVLDTDSTFLTWNRTDMGWNAINRADYTQVTVLTEGETLGVNAIDSVGTDIYGYDANDQLFKLNLETYERTLIGEPVADDLDNGMIFEVRDMAYDEANDQMLVLGAWLWYDEFWGDYYEMGGGCSVYSVDLTTGELTSLYQFWDHAYVFSLACDENGTVYFYETQTDGIYSLDLETGTVTSMCSLQRLSVYGEGTIFGVRQDMYYDALTGKLYMAFTSNNNVYRMVTCDLTTANLEVVSYIGEFDQDFWCTDLYTGLTAQEVSNECDHTNLIREGADDATCTEGGWTGHLVCDDCGLILERTSATEPTEHPHTSLKDAADATCCKEGYTGDLVCDDCHEILEKGEVIPVNDVHGDNLATEGAKDASCCEEGYTGDLVCKDCNEIVKKGEVIPVNDVHGDNLATEGAKDASCTEDGYTGDLVCKDCDKVLEEGEVITATGHEMGEWVVVKYPTSITKGEEVRECAHCDYSESRDIDPLGDIVTPPTSDNFPLFAMEILVLVSAAALCMLFFFRKSLSQK